MCSSVRMACGRRQPPRLVNLHSFRLVARLVNTPQKCPPYATELYLSNFLTICLNCLLCCTSCMQGQIRQTSLYLKSIKLMKISKNCWTERIEKNNYCTGRITFKRLLQIYTYVKVENDLSQLSKADLSRVLSSLWVSPSVTWSRTVARKSSIGGHYVCGGFTLLQGGGLTFKFDKNSTNL